MSKEKFYKNLPETPGVYLMKDASGRVLYTGKAGNLKRRVSSYFTRPHDSRIEKLLCEVKKIDYKKTDTAIEALILESELIKKFEPIYNVREKDDKSFLYVEITDERFPRVLLVRGKQVSNKSYEIRSRKIFGPFTSASSIRQALRILRKIFPFSVHVQDKLGKFKRACFEYEIGLCPGTCFGAISRTDYLKNIKNFKLFLAGKKKTILNSLTKEMHEASKKLEFERAEKLRRQIFALQHIQDIALITDEQIADGKAQSVKRIEGYDVSNISGTSAVGSMVVFRGIRPDKNEYRKFKIKTITKADDIGMLKEVLRRRLTHLEWQLPDLILIDGGKGQVNAADSVLSEHGIKIPVVGIAKGSKRKKNEFFGEVPDWTSEASLIKVRNEAHRFAIAYHKKLRMENFRRLTSLRG